MKSSQLSQLNDIANEMGFLLVGITDTNMDSEAIARFEKYHDAGYFGEMNYLMKNIHFRKQPADLQPNCSSIITLICPYLSDNSMDWIDKEWHKIHNPSQAYISIYARGIDYHKELRKRAKEIGRKLALALGEIQYRVTVDSAPILEVELAAKSGLGWRGKNTLLLNKSAGSLFFLTEILLNIQLEPTPKTSNHCGTCKACIDICPTAAIVAPYILDARRCISYLTIELAGTIPIEFRPLIGNRIFGCDDCQLICPWNKFAKKYSVADFSPKDVFNSSNLLELWDWDEPTFNAHTQRSPIKRIGYQRWLRNLAVALGNALRTLDDKTHKDHIESALHHKLPLVGDMVAEHIQWALSTVAKHQG